MCNANFFESRVSLWFCMFLLAIGHTTLCTHAYYISLDAQAEQCFFERLDSPEGTKMTLMFEVVEGGFLDVDVTVNGPDGKSIYAGQRESSGKYTFAAHTPGRYKYCFSNKMSTMTPKIVMFQMDVAAARLEHSEEGVKVNGSALFNKAGSGGGTKLEAMMTELSNALIQVKHAQEYMEVRERVHRTINENTNSRVVLWAAFESAILLAMTVAQIFYLKRFFEVRRVI